MVGRLFLSTYISDRSALYTSRLVYPVTFCYEQTHIMLTLHHDITPFNSIGAVYKITLVYTLVITVILVSVFTSKVNFSCDI